MNLDRRWLVGLVLVAAIEMTPARGYAQSDEQRAAARTAATQGIEAFRAGEYAESIDLLDRAQAVIDAPTHLLYLARAHDKLGRLVKAREIYLKLSREELGPKAPRAFRAAVADGARELAALEPRIAYVTVRVRNAPAGSVELTENDVPVPSVFVGIERPIDPGKVVFRASARGFSPATAKINLSEGAREAVELTLDKVAEVGTEGSAGPADPAIDPEGASGLTRAGLSKEAASSSPLRTLGYVGFGAAAVGIGAGVYWLVQANQDSNRSDQLYAECNPRICSDDERAQVLDKGGDAKTKNTLAIASFIAGGAFLAAAVTLVVLPSNGAEHQSGIRPWLGLNSIGVDARF